MRRCGMIGGFSPPFWKGFLCRPCFDGGGAGTTIVPRLLARGTWGSILAINSTKRDDFLRTGVDFLSSRKSPGFGVTASPNHRSAFRKRNKHQRDAIGMGHLVVDLVSRCMHSVREAAVPSPSFHLSSLPLPPPPRPNLVCLLLKRNLEVFPCQQGFRGT